MKKLFLLLGIIAFTVSYTFGQGLKLATQVQLDDVEVWIDDDRGFSGTLPSSFTMEEFCPPVMTQKGSSCVGWSIYATMSTMYNYLTGTTHPYQKFALAFDPYYIYAALKKSYDIDCKDGIYMMDAMQFLLDNGNKRWGMDPYYTCNSDWSSEKWKYTQWVCKPFSPNEIYVLETIEDVKKCISIYQPVMVGMAYGQSMGPLGSAGGTVGADGLWTPKKDENVDGGHAMTVVGYDDNKYGGAFRLMNSWGSDYGDEGFIWIKYSDFKKLAHEAYVMYPKLLSDNKEDITINTDYYTRVQFDNGITYEGTYYDGKAHGQGFYIFNNGNVFFTSFNEGEYHGWGIYFDVENWKMIDFEHDNGELISKEERGFGASKSSELDSYLESFTIEGERAEIDNEFELPETPSLSKSNNFNFNKGGFNFNKTNN